MNTMVTVPGDTASTPAAPVIAFLGTGRMGGPMAANLARAGFTVRAWDRTASHAAALAGPARPRRPVPLKRSGAPAS